MRRFRIFVCLLGLALTANHVVEPRLAQASEGGHGQTREDAEPWLAKLKARRQPEIASLETVGGGFSYNRLRGRLEVGYDQGQVVVDFIYYQAQSQDVPAGPTPLLLIYSGVGGITPLESHLARYFAARGVFVVISHYFNEDNTYDISRHNTEAFESFLASFALTDYFSAQPEIAADKIGVLGVSYGGLRGLFHTLLDPRVKGSVLMVAGASLSDILAYSTLPRVKAVRSHQMREAGLQSQDDYFRYLKEHHDFRFEDFAHQRQATDFQLIISNNDPWVPTFSQWRLWETLGRPEHFAYEAGHLRTPIYASLTRTPGMLSFFRAHWKIDDRIDVVPSSDQDLGELAAVEPW